MRGTILFFRKMDDLYPAYFRRVCFDDDEENEPIAPPSEKKEPVTVP